MSEVEETISRIKSHKSIEGLLITDKDKKTIRTNYTGEKLSEGDLLRNTIPLFIFNLIFYLNLPVNIV